MRHGGARRITRLALDLGVSPLAYYGLAAAGVGISHALLAATIVAGAWLLCTTLLDRKIDGLAAFMLGMYGVMFVLAAVTSDERLLLLRDPLTSGLAGLVFLGSCATALPATEYLAHKLHGGASPGARRAYAVESAVLGAGLLAEAIARVVLVFTLPIGVAAGLVPAVEFAVLPLLVGWMVWYRSRARSRRVGAIA